MVFRVLVAMDESETSEKALRYTLEVHSDAEITVLHVVGEPSPMMGEIVGLTLEGDIEEAAKEKADDVFNKAKEIADEYGKEIITEVDWGNPAKVIIENSTNFDTLIIGSNQSTLKDRILVGKVAETVFRKSSVPVTVVR